MHSHKAEGFLCVRTVCVGPKHGRQTGATTGCCLEAWHCLLRGEASCACAGYWEGNAAGRAACHAITRLCVGGVQHSAAVPVCRTDVVITLWPACFQGWLARRMCLCVQSCRWSQHQPEQLQLVCRVSAGQEVSAATDGGPIQD